MSAGEIEAILEFVEGRWQARLPNHPEWSALYVDFSAERFSERSLRAMGKSAPLAKAIGFGKRPVSAEAPMRVVDATAGLGADAWFMAWLGCEVAALERNPTAHALLADGLERAPNRGVADRIRAERADAVAWLAGAAREANRPHAIYLDPMFEEDSSKTALPRKHMQLFRELIGHEPLSDAALLEAALACALERVVVKRAARATPLAGKPAQVSYLGKTVRFDAYVIGPKRPS